MKVVLGIISALTLASNASAAARESALVSRIEIRAFSHTACLQYANDNDYDGDCIESRTTCSFELTFPNENVLGKREVYRVYDLPFLGLTAPVNSDCDRDAADWQAQNAKRILTYTIDESVSEETLWLSPSAIGIPLRNQNSYNPRTCYRIRTVSGHARFDGYSESLPMDGGIEDPGSLDGNLTTSTPLDDKDCRFIDTE